MADSVTELQLNDYLDIVRRRRLLIAAVAIAAIVLAAAASALQTPQFRAQARVAVDASAGSGLLDDDANVSSNVRDRNLNNEVEFAESDRVRERATETFGSDADATISASGSSDILSFTVVDPDPDVAATIANTFAEAYVTERSIASGERFIAATDVINDRLSSISEERFDLESELENTTDSASVQIQLDALANEESRLRGQLNEIDVLSQLNSSTSVAILNAADAPSSPFAPSWIRNIALAIVAGLILGLGTALVLETLDDTVLTKRDLENAADGTPVVGVIPSPFKGRFNNRKVYKLVTSRSGAFTESFRSLRSAIELGQATGTEIRSILVTSANPTEGKSTVAAHLAISFARSGASVLVIDADMHNPTQHKLFGLENENGLAEQLSQIGNAEILTEMASGEGLLSVLPAGSSGSSPADLLRSVPAQEFIEKLTFAFDLVIIDSPPLRPVADTLPLARITDATLLAAMRGQTNAREVDQAMELLARAQTRPLGTVLNSADENDGGYGYGYGYGQSTK